MGYKHDYDKTLTRLISILSQLNSGDALSVSELAMEFNVSTRTIQRDFNERLISFPIERVGKRWKMQEGFRLEKSTSIEDRVVLDIMEGLISGTDGTFATKAKNLLSKLKNEEHNPIYTKLNIEDISDKLKEIQQLESAIKSQTKISCEYALKSKIPCRLCPKKIANYEGFWYLLAIDEKDNILKKYYLKNISKVKQLNETFKTDKALDKKLDNALSIWFDAKKEPFEVILSLDKQIAKYFERKPISPTQTTHEIQDDGSIQIAIKITHEMEVIPLVKYWIPYMRVVEPTWIRDKIEEDLRRYLS